MPVTALAELTALNATPFGPQTIAVLPVGATEPHGPHLPLTTDCDIAEGHLRALPGTLDPEIDVVILPLERVGASLEHSAFAGCQSAEPGALIARWTEVAGRVAGQGGRRLVIVSSHGGNTPAVDATILAARARFAMLAVGTAWMRFGQPEGLFGADEVRHGIHGGAIETALMLHYAPDRVDMGRARDFASALPRLERDFTLLTAFGRHRFGWMSQDLNPAGVMGDAAAATARMGAASAAHALAGFSHLLAEIARFDLGFFKDGPR